MDYIIRIAKALEVTVDQLLCAEKESDYLNPESAQIAHEAVENPNLRILFNASRNLSPQDLKYIIYLIKRLEKEKNPDPEDFADKDYEDDCSQNLREF